MDFSEIKTELIGMGIAEQQAWNMANRLTMDDRTPTLDEVRAYGEKAIAARSKTKKPDLFESFGLRMSSNGPDR